jgi:hypothetical protein
MRYLYRFFPYRSLYHFDENSLTAYWVIITIMLFITLWVYLIIKIVKLREKLTSLVESFSIKSCRQSKWMRKLCEEYFKTFISLDGNGKKTFEKSSKYFNDQNILNQYLNLRFWYMVPGTFVGFGILGTFVGLTIGISEFNINTVDNIKKSIQTLLSGMGTAFVSSVWGMLLSIVFSVSEKYLFKDISKITKALSETLDNSYHLNKTDELRIIKDNQREVIKKLLVFKDDNNQEVLPAYVFRDLQKESRDQTKILKSFSTDLADGIKISAETINALGSHLGRAISRPLREDFAPLLKRIDEAVQELRSIKEESSSEVIERVMSELRESLVGIGGNLQEALTNSVSEQLNQLASIISNAGASLSNFPSQQKSMLGMIDGQVLKIGDGLAKLMVHLDDGISKQRDMINDTCTKADEASEKAIKRMSDETNNATELMRKTITSMQNNTLEILNKQEEISKFIKNTLFNYADILKQGSVLNTELNKTIYKLSLSNSTLSKIFTNLTESTHKISDGINILHKSLNKYQDSPNSSGNSLQFTKEDISQAYLVASDQANKFKMIEDGMNNIFSQLQGGLKDYQDATYKPLNKNLDEFSLNLAQTVKCLKTSIEELQEIVNKLAVTKLRLVN